MTGAPLATAAPSQAAALSLGAAVERYAPLVQLHPDETLLPMRPKDFIGLSELKWAHDSGCPDHPVVGLGAIDPARLAKGTYPAHSTNPRTYSAPLCEHRRDSFTTADHTRPFDTLGPQGFYLDYHGSRTGSALDVPVYYEVNSQAGATTVHYWFFYAYNDFDVPHGPDQFHEGDWERITVRLNAENRATDVAYWNHGGYCTRRWSGVTKTKPGAHPVVFSALGSHASYPEPGNHKIVVHNFFDQVDRTQPSTKKWRTWNARVDVRSPDEGW